MISFVNWGHPGAPERSRVNKQCSAVFGTNLQGGKTEEVREVNNFEHDRLALAREL